MNATLLCALTLLLAGVAGGVLGAIFFGGLWWTVRKSMTSPHAALWIFTSLLARMGFALGGLYFVADGQWQRLLAGLLGFVLARLLVIRVTRTPNGSSQTMREASHAP